MNRLLARFALAAAVIAPSAAMPADRTIVLSVKNMDCAACPSIVKASLQTVPGVSQVLVSYRDRTATITYDDAKAGLDQLTSATANAGYPSMPKS